MTRMSFVSPLDPLAIENGDRETVYIAADDTRFTVLKPFDARRAERAIRALQHRFKAKAFQEKPRRAVREQLDVLALAQSRDQFCDGLERLFENYARAPHRPYFLLSLCTLLWSEGLLLFPRNIMDKKQTALSTFFKVPQFICTAATFGCAHEFFQDFSTHLAQYGSDTHDRIRRITLRALLTVGRFNHRIVFTPEVVTALLEYTPPPESKNFFYLKTGIYTVNRMSGAEDMNGRLDVHFNPVLTIETAHLPVPAHLPRPRARRSDKSFAWAVSAEPELEIWRSLLATWIAGIKNRKNLRNRIGAGNHILEYLRRNRDITRIPQQYLRTDYIPPIAFPQYLHQDVGLGPGRSPSYSQYLGYAHDFFEYVLDELCSEQEAGSRYRLRGFTNPISPAEIPAQDVQPGQTNRLAMPARWVEILKDILTRDDCRWAKETFDVDWFHWHNPATGQRERIWNPVRAYAVLMKLLLPLRTHQVRMLDSGEGDPEIINPTTGRWERNSLDLAIFKEPQGFLHRIWDGTRTSWFTGLFINTNKTQERVSGDIEAGYVIPWQNDEVIELALMLRDWQTKYNPIVAPTPFSELGDSANSSDDVVRRTPNRYYLFRDACGESRHVPVTIGRLRRFWLSLCLELERELVRRNIRNEDGTKIEIIDSYQNDKPATSIFDLHSLRVTGLTAFVQAGVPIHILSQLVAGHATILMTLYYARIEIGHITNVLNDAQAKMQENAQNEMTAFIRSLSVSESALRTAFNSLDGLRSAKCTQPGIYRFMDHGICPNGQTKCAEGGEALVDQKDRKHYGPVRGGDLNCPLCRFFITGPQFLIGLVARFNELSHQLSELSKVWRMHQAEKQRLQSERIAAEQNNEPFLKERELRLAIGHSEEYLEKVNICAETLHAVFNLIQQSKRILAENPTPDVDAGHAALPLIVKDAAQLDAGLSSVPEFELVDEICRSARFYKSINWTVANLRRKDMFCQMLIRNGLEPIYIGLPDEIAKQALDVACDLLLCRVGRTKLNELISGESRLKELGFHDELIDLLKSQVGRPIQEGQVLETAHASPQALAHCDGSEAPTRTT